MFQYHLYKIKACLMLWNICTDKIIVSYNLKSSKAYVFDNIFLTIILNSNLYYEKKATIFANQANITSVSLHTISY